MKTPRTISPEARLRQIKRQIDKHKEAIGKHRDALRELVDDAEAVVESAEEGVRSLDWSLDRLKRFQSAMGTITKKIERRKAAIDASGDALQGLSNEIDEIAKLSSDGIDALERAIDSFSQYL